MVYQDIVLHMQRLSDSDCVALEDDFAEREGIVYTSTNATTGVVALRIHTGHISSQEVLGIVAQHHLSYTDVSISDV
jgi:hypothetical protein